MFQTMVQNKQNKTYVTNLSHIKQVVTGGPVGCVWPSAKGLVIGAATERTLGTPDSVRLNEKVKRVIEHQRSYHHRIIPRSLTNTIYFSRDPCSTIIPMQIAQQTIKQLFSLHSRESYVIIVYVMYNVDLEKEM